MKKNPRNRAETAARITRISGGFMAARMLHAGVRLGLFEALAGGPLGAAALARKLSTDRQATEVLANALVPLGLLAKGGAEGRYRLTRLSRSTLVAGAPAHVADMIRHHANMLDGWMKLEGCQVQQLFLQR